MVKSLNLTSSKVKRLVRTHNSTIVGHLRTHAKSISKTHYQGNEAANVTGPSGVPVKGSPFAADRRSYFRPRGGRGGSFSRGGGREGGSRDEGEEGGKDEREGGGERRRGGGGATQRGGRPYRGRFFRRPRGSTRNRNSGDDQGENGEDRYAIKQLGSSRPKSLIF